MANATTGNPIIIDTATATAILATDKLKLLAVQWVSGSTANVCSVQDAAGTVKWEAVGSTANYTLPVVFPDELPLILNGLKVPTLDSGKVYLYVKRIA